MKRGMLTAALLAASVFGSAVSSQSFAGDTRELSRSESIRAVQDHIEKSTVRISKTWKRDGVRFVKVSSWQGLPMGTYAVDLEDGTVRKATTAAGKRVLSVHDLNKEAFASFDSEFPTTTRNEARDMFTDHLAERGKYADIYKYARVTRVWEKNGRFYAKTRTALGLPAGTFIFDPQTGDVVKMRKRRR